MSSSRLNSFSLAFHRRGAAPNLDCIGEIQSYILDKSPVQGRNSLPRPMQMPNCKTVLIPQRSDYSNDSLNLPRTKKFPDTASHRHCCLLPRSWGSNRGSYRLQMLIFFCLSLKSLPTVSKEWRISPPWMKPIIQIGTIDLFAVWFSAYIGRLRLPLHRHCNGRLWQRRTPLRRAKLTHA